MIALARIITAFEGELVERYGDRLLPSQQQALAAIKHCRSVHSARMQVQCSACQQQALAAIKHCRSVHSARMHVQCSVCHQQTYVPHSCGHRSCPHCQHHESEQWLQRQLRRQVPAEYFLLTFTLPAQLRAQAWDHQRLVYDALLGASWDTLRTFSQNDKRLRGTPGAIAVLHTHSRRLDYHPHVHVIMPAAAIDAKRRLWRTKTSPSGSPWLFAQQALAKVFRAKVLEAISRAGLSVPERTPARWVVDCKAVGSGKKALVYLGRYLYRGVIREKDILTCRNGQVTFRYQDSKTRRWQTRTLPGADFLWLVLRHVLPRRFRRTRNFGFLHPNSKHLIALVQLLLKVDLGNAKAFFKVRPAFTCSACGGTMKVIRTRLPPPPRARERPPAGLPECLVM